MSALSNFMRARREEILREWTGQVRGLLQGGGPGRKVPLGDLARILESIIGFLEAELPSSPGEGLPRPAAVARLPRGYELSEVVLQYAMLRRAILELWSREVGATMQIAELVQLDTALDSSTVESVVRFAKARERLLVAVDRISMAALGKGQLPAFLQELVRTTEQISQTVGSVVVLLREGDSLRVQSSVGVEVLAGTRLRIGHGFAGTIAAALTPVSLRWDPARPRRYWGEEPIAPGTRALFGVPLVQDGHLLGVLQLGSFTEDEFSEEDQAAFLAVGNRATAMILHVQLSMERDHLLAESKQLLEKAQQAVTARQDLLSIVSHDLRNPLSTVTLNAEQLARLAVKNEGAGWVSEKVAAILVSTGQMRRLVDDLLDLARIETGQLLRLERTRRDGSELARQAVESFQPLASSRGLTLAGELEPGPCEIDCDPDRIHQVLSNLIGNAIHFTREGGSITLRTARNGTEVVFSITDTGVGIPDDQLARIFNPYWQGWASSGRGVGLGLSVSKAIVDAHGGRIWVESRLGHGSTFSFALPAVDGAEAQTSQEHHEPT